MTTKMLLILITTFTANLSFALESQERNKNEHKISFQEKVIIVSGVKLACPQQEMVPCLKGSLLLDPGHDDQEDSRRTSSKYFSEGRSNMVISILLREMLIRCGNVSTENIHLVRWPGENFYGEYETPQDARISIHQPTAKMDGILSRVAEIKSHSGYNKELLILSLHSNSSGNPKIRPDRVEVYYPISASQDLINLSKSMKDALVTETLPAYKASSTKELERIRNAVMRKSFYRPEDFAVLTELTGPSNISKLLIEMFYMDSSQKQFIDKESNLTRAGTLSVAITINDKNSSLIKNEIYSVADLQIASVYGLYRGLSCFNK